jgi:hypothetical protein
METTDMPNDQLPFIDPSRTGGKTKLARAPRPIDLAGKTIGLLDNTKEQADVILETVGQALREKYGVAEVIIQRKEFFSKPAKPELIDDMASRVQVAVAALGG